MKAFLEKYVDGKATKTDFQDQVHLDDPDTGSKLRNTLPRTERRKMIKVATRGNIQTEQFRETV